jgi:hypothetical protein
LVTVLVAADFEVTFTLTVPTAPAGILLIVIEVVLEEVVSVWENSTLLSPSLLYSTTMSTPEAGIALNITTLN